LRRRSANVASGTESRWGRHPTSCIAEWRQLVESQAGCAGSNSDAIESHAFRKQNALKSLLSIKRCVCPESCGVGQCRFGEGQYGFNVEFIDARLVPSEQRESQVLP